LGRPSIFSRNYEEQMRRRRINITLIILILISAGFFYTKYHLNKRGITFNFKQKISFFNKIKTPTKQKQEINEGIKNNTNDKIPENKQGKNKEQLFKEYVYTSNTQRQFKVIYKEENGNKTFIEVKADGIDIDFDISKDKKSIVFDDKENQSIIVCDENGNFQDITLKTLKVKEFVFVKDKVIKGNKEYIWAQKPHFTSDDRIVFLTRLPYYATKRGIFIWYADYNGINAKRIAELSYDINSIKFDGYDEKGGLRIISDEKVYILEVGSYRLRQIN